MTASKNFLRDLLGLALIVSTAFAVLSFLLDIMGGIAYFSHEDIIASAFFHESLYFIAFLIPPYFIWKFINRPELIVAVQEYQLNKSKNEQF
ncbi:D-fructose-6-phosphate amidotransferase [Vibrionales bacterium C3R12]|nr:D-fructose-6-phosphate amidotransferase [Vibrionales bacterium C3R12]